MAEQTIDRLSIEINAKANASVGGIDKLAQSIQRLKSAVGGGTDKLSGIAASIDRLKTALSGFKGTSGSVSSLAKSLERLQAIKLEGVGAKLSEFSNAVKSLDTVGESLQSIRDFGKGVTSMTKSFDKLEKMDMKSISARILELVAALKPLTNEMIRAGSGVSNFGDQMKSLAQALRSANSMKSQIAKQTQRSRSGTGGLNGLFSIAKIGAVIYGLERVGRAIKGAIGNVNSYIEDMNLFAVSMGSAAREGEDLAQKMQDLLGVDAGQAMRNMGVFRQMTTSFGVAGEKATVLSKNLTQLGYDMASFYNINSDAAFEKLQAGISGETEPLRRLGIDISEARLQQELYNLGIKESVRNLSQADKAQLRYIAIMEQTKNAQADMARTIMSPANALRVLQAQLQITARNIGSIFIPALNAILPYAIAVVKVIGELAARLAQLVGFKMPDFEIPETSLPDISGDLGDIGDEAEKAGKKMNQLISGFDELNILSKDTGIDKSEIGDILGGIELPEYDPFENLVNSDVDKIVDDIMKKFDDILAIVGSIGAAIAAWKLAKGLLSALEYINKLKGKDLKYSIGFTIAGLGWFLDAWNTMKEAIQDIINNGPNFTNVTKLISGFAEGLGAAFILLGNVKLGSAMLLIAGISGIISDISDIVKNGPNWDNVMSLVKNLGLFISGIGGVFFKNNKIIGIGAIISGVALVLQNLKALIKGFTTGDFSDVNWIEVASGALLIVGGLIIVFKKIGDIPGKESIGKAKETIDTVKIATDGVDTSVGQLSSKLSSLAKNLGLGLVIVAEVAAGALLLTGAIILLGKELEQVGLAWEPVIANGSTVAAAMGIGVGILGGVGVVTALLGSAGTPLITNIALGTAILAELGIATGLFIIEIWAIGKGLDEIGKAWQPVLNNGETIATGIGLGTTLLVGIGVVTAALGVATVASAGTLPIAIGLGTAILVELAAAFVLFTKSLSDVADELSNNLYPSLNKLNEKLPTLSNNMGDFVKFMTEFADHVVSYTKVSAISGLSATIDTIIGWFTQDPIKKLAKDVNKIYEQTFDLNEKLKLAVPELKSASDLLKQYKTFLSEIESLTSTNVSLSNEMFVNMNEVGQKLVTGFVNGIKSRSTDYTNTAKDLTKGFIDNLTNGITSGKQTAINAFNQLTSALKSSADSAFSVSVMQTYGKNIATGISTGISSNVRLMTEPINSLQRTLNDGISKAMETVKQSVSNSMQNLSSAVSQNMNNLSNSISRAMDNASNSVSRAVSNISNELSRLTSRVDNAMRKLDSLNNKSRSASYSSYDSDDDWRYRSARKAPNIPAFATGGVVRKPTYALVGDNPNAHNNPEVIAPQSTIEESVVAANGELASALYQMATMIVEAIENNGVEISADSKGIFKVVKKEAGNYKRVTGSPAF